MASSRHERAPVLGSSLVLAVFGLSFGCVALRPPALGGGPVVSPAGVTLAVTRQSCTQTRDEPTQRGYDLVEERIEVQVRNGAPAPIAIKRDGFRLVTPEGFALRTVTWRAADPLTLSGGETRTFVLRFMTRGSLGCARPMALDPGSAAIILGDRPVRLAPVRFTPARAI